MSDEHGHTAEQTAKARTKAKTTRTDRSSGTFEVEAGEMPEEANVTKPRATKRKAKPAPEPDPRGQELIRQLGGFMGDQRGGKAYDLREVRRFLDLTADLGWEKHDRVEEEMLPLMDRILALLQIFDAKAVTPMPKRTDQRYSHPVDYAVSPTFTAEGDHVRSQPLTRLEHTLEICAPTDSRVMLVQEDRHWWRCEVIPPHAARSDLAEDHHRRKAWHCTAALAAARALLPSR